MKISKIKLNGYQQFKDIEFDFTYPIGHKNAGKTLQKICIIGQSGTGKTSILRLIKYFVSRNRLIGQNLNIPPIPNNTVLFEMFRDDLFVKLLVNDGTFAIRDYTKNGNKIDANDAVTMLLKYDENKKPLLINYPAEVIRGNKFEATELTAEKKEKRIKETLAIIETIEPQQIVDFAVEEIEKIRNFIFKEIKEYKAKELLQKSKISDTALNKKGSINDIHKITKEYEEWLAKNPDPLFELAKALDALLNKFGLRIKTEMDLESILALGDIQLQTLNGVDIDRPFWSTGTRHIVDTFVPLFELKPKEAVILMDEPEKSLFPDMQEQVIDFYTTQNSTCQFFFATHSPLIAASFDPWEVFHLEYDETNTYVRLLQNYTGEKHIDNYNYYPKYLRWDSILMNVFKMPNEGSDERNTKLMTVAKQFRELEKMKNDGKDKTARYKKLRESFLIEAKKIGWDEKINQK